MSLVFMREVSKTCYFVYENKYLVGSIDSTLFHFYPVLEEDYDYKKLKGIALFMRGIGAIGVPERIVFKEYFGMGLYSVIVGSGGSCIGMVDSEFTVLKEAKVKFTVTQVEKIADFLYNLEWASLSYSWKQVGF